MISNIRNYVNMLIFYFVSNYLFESCSFPGQGYNSSFFLSHRYDGLHHGSSYLEHLHFLSAVKAPGDRAPAVDLHDGLLSVAMGVAGQLSIERGSFVTIEEVMG